MISDIERVIDTIFNWINFRLVNGEKEGILIHLDGTLNSAVLASMCLDRFPDKTFVYVLNVGGMNSNGHQDRCINFINHSKINYKVYDLNKTLDSFPKEILGNHEIEGKLRGCLFHMVLNSIAYNENRLLLKAVDKGEIEIEYPNEYYSMGLCPLGLLYRSEIVLIAKYYKVPEEIINTEPSHNLYLGQNIQKDHKILSEELEWACRILQGGKTIDTTTLNPRQQVVVGIVSKLITTKNNKYSKSNFPPLVRNSKLLR